MLIRTDLRVSRIINKEGTKFLRRARPLAPELIYSREWMLSKKPPVLAQPLLPLCPLSEVHLYDKA